MELHEHPVYLAQFSVITPESVNDFLEQNYRQRFNLKQAKKEIKPSTLQPRKSKVFTYPSWIDKSSLI